MSSAITGVARSWYAVDSVLAARDLQHQVCQAYLQLGTSKDASFLYVCTQVESDVDE